MSSVATSPGLYFTRAPRLIEASPLRSDVAGFIGQTQRGPIARAVRVEEWRGFIRVFGGLTHQADAPYAIKGYFENGGEVAYVIRLGEPFPSDDEIKFSVPVAEQSTVNVAVGSWTVGVLDKATREWGRNDPAAAGFAAAQYQIKATSPGSWANRTRVSLGYRFDGVSGQPEVDLVVQAANEPTEYLVGINPAEIVERVAASSNLIRLVAEGPVPALTNAIGPRSVVWPDVILEGGVDVSPSIEQYLKAIQRLGDEPEVALSSLPDLYRHVIDSSTQKDLLMAAIRQSDATRDRLVVLDLPPSLDDQQAGTNRVEGIVNWVNELRALDDSGALRAAAAYHPQVRVPDPLGDISTPLRTIPSSGHVAGVISLLDRQRGAHHTPANAELIEAVDIDVEFAEPERALLNDSGINLLRCVPGRGLQVWGGRTLTTGQPATSEQLLAASAAEKSARFVAHRRLIHRLIRAIRRVADPLVFDINGPELWLTFVRAITTVLLEAFRAGALKGARPEEAFRVRCDGNTTPPEEVELGCVFCEIELAPATPMEFILLRVAFSSDGTLEVFES